MIMRTLKAAFALALLMAALAGPAEASLLIIGTATYGGTNYNLIYDDNPSGSIVWLDYTHTNTWWAENVAWASGLTLTYNFFPGYSMTWSGNWRLPTGATDTNSEQSYLFYTELGNTGYYDLNHLGSANVVPFDNINRDMWYWSGSEDSQISGYAWVFNWCYGIPNFATEEAVSQGDAMAVRSGKLVVSESASVPEPSTMLLLGVGLAGLAGVRLRRRGR